MAWRTSATRASRNAFRLRRGGGARRALNGHPTRYIPSLTGNLDAMRDADAVARDAGLDCVMLAPMICGLSRDAGAGARFSGHGILCPPEPRRRGADRAGWLLGKLFPLMGADAVIFPKFRRAVRLFRRHVPAAGGNARRPDGWHEGRAAGAGGRHDPGERTREILDFYGADTMLLIGGNLLVARDRITEATERFTRAVADHLVA